ncbi:MAG TPA: AmmeMemoRadiSam system protein B, partial [Candidatus Polarisedimenticolia bacterium]|nr:AmmeMemoRadiSam system protein B [Candidatus Polarisedimenticolia bacterium]
MSVRRPAVAGYFYPGEPAELQHDLDAMLKAGRPPEGASAVALLVPHAGYIYSGPVAAATYLSSPLPRRFILLGPNHTGEGQAIAVFSEGAWRTPLGETPIDSPLAEALLARCAVARSDEEAHRREHSLEVQVPFLQRLAGEVRILPVCVGTDRLPVLLDLGRAVAEAVREAGEAVLIIISSDMSHYLPAEAADRQDHKAIDRLLAVDPEGLHRVVLSEEISMCGVAPAVAGLEAARRLGAR